MTLPFAASPFARLPAFSAEGPPLLNAIVDTPQGSPHKYKYDEALGVFRLQRVLSAGLVFPYNFGYIPSTLGADGDPLDVLLLMDAPAFVGCLVVARLIGVIEATQVEAGAQRAERNDRLVAVADKALNQRPLLELRQVPPHRLDEIEHFFVAYTSITGKRFTPLRRGSAARAQRLLAQGIRAFENRA